MHIQIKYTCPPKRHLARSTYWCGAVLPLSLSCRCLQDISILALLSRARGPPLVYLVGESAAFVVLRTENATLVSHTDRSSGKSWFGAYVGTSVHTSSASSSLCNGWRGWRPSSCPSSSSWEQACPCFLPRFPKHSQRFGLSGRLSSGQPASFFCQVHPWPAWQNSGKPKKWRPSPISFVLIHLYLYILFANGAENEMVLAKYPPKSKLMGPIHVLSTNCTQHACCANIASEERIFLGFFTLLKMRLRAFRLDSRSSRSSGWSSTEEIACAKACLQRTCFLFKDARSSSVFLCVILWRLSSCFSIVSFSFCSKKECLKTLWTGNSSVIQSASLLDTAAPSAVATWTANAPNISLSPSLLPHLR